jgi:hypothetical protein
MTISRRSHLTPVGKMTPLSDWWLVRITSTRIADILTYRTIRGRDAPDIEMDIEMQAFNPSLTDLDDDQSTSRPEQDLEKGDMRMRIRTVSHLTRKWKKVD